ncbi:MAG: hypothetical protein AB1782_04530 [Cyanobacteriota bacterium]
MFIKKNNKVYYRFLLVIIIVVSVLTSCMFRDKSAENTSNVIRDNVKRINEENAPVDIALNKTPPPVTQTTNKIITAELVNKGKLENNTEKFYYYLPIKLKIKNITAKDLEYVSSKIYFKNKDNHMIGYTSIDIKEKIPAGQTIELSDEYIMSVKEEHKTFIDSNPRDIGADTNLFAYKFANEDLQEIRFWGQE